MDVVEAEVEVYADVEAQEGVVVAEEEEEAAAVVVGKLCSKYLHLDFKILRLGSKLIRCRFSVCL